MESVMALQSPQELFETPFWFRTLPVEKDVHTLAGGYVAVTGNESVKMALTNPWLLAEHPLKSTARVLGPNVIDSDGPRHKAFRKLLAPILSRSSINQYMNSFVPPLVTDLVNEITGLTTNDFHGQFARRVPYGIISTLLGIDPSLEDKFHTLSRPLAGILDYPSVQAPNLYENTQKLLALIRAQQSSANEDSKTLLATLTRTRNQKHIDLTDEEIYATALLFFLAGTETSTAFITSLIYCLARYDIELALEPDRSYLNAVVEEALRLYPPVQTIIRFAHHDVEISGVKIPRHTAVVVSLAAANRDPKVFDEPDSFDYTRSHDRSLPFSTGPHSCPGAGLAKEEFILLLSSMSRKISRVNLLQDADDVASQSFSHPDGFIVHFESRA